MNAVRILPEDLANQIAAGEVVERPASVVKELLENALDAGARRIRVDIEHGGVESIRVADDGAGMEREDASLSVLRHATSKLTRIDDLHSIRSFGFRGEALPSIASVSRFELRTRRADVAEGTLVRLAGGGPPEVAPCGCAAGTVVEVRELFFNVPARRKFLKSIGTESARVTEVVEAAALGEPSVTLILSRDGKVAGEWLRASCREERARSVFAGEELAVCRGERGPLAVEGFLSRPERARSGAAWLSIFVNGRPVKDRTLARSVALAYGSVLESGRYPVGVVYLDLPHELVDVNVHPQKAEVRFAEARAVGDALFKIVGAAVAEAFGLPDPARSRGKKQTLYEDPAGPAASSWVFSGPPPASPPLVEPPSTEEQERPSLLPSPPVWEQRPAPPAREPAPMPVVVPEPDGLPVEDPSERKTAPSPVPYPTAVELAAARDKQPVFAALRFVAQVRSTFFVCEGPDGLYLLDQHAAAERVTFHRLKRGFDAREVATQRLLFPVIVNVTPSEAALVEDQQDALARTGLDLRVAGTSAVAVHAVPSLLPKASPERLVRDLLDEVSHAGERAFSGAMDRAIATMACHGSLRAGDAVAPDEAKALLKSLDEVDFAGHCPHGRPVVMRIGWGELEHRVGRR